MKNTILILSVLLGSSLVGVGQEFTSSNLPLFVINTQGQEIVDEPDIIATIYTIDNGTGNLHTLNDPHTYDGDVNIEIRGSSSQGFDKNNFALETIDVMGNDLDTNLLGFPKEEDWILHGPWADKSLLRNDLSMYIFREMGRYSSRTRFCELFINDEYWGVYLFMEKIKRDDDRIDIAKLNPDEVSGDDVTGGYILKFDWPEGEGWDSQYDAVGGPPLYFQYVYPKPNAIVPEQEQYIQTFVDSFETALFDPEFHHPSGKRYNEFIDIYSFIDQFIVNELAKDVDAYKLSTFMHKDKDSNDPRLKAGPIWDYNIAWFNASYCDGGNHEGWLFNEMQCEDLELMPAWWERFWTDPYFLNALNCRWNELRAGFLSNDNLQTYINDRQALLTEAAARNYERWDIIEEETWAHPFELPGSWAGEVDLLRTWVHLRADWMDANMPGDCSLSISKPAEQEFEVFPNPSSGNFTIRHAANADGFLEVRNYLGQAIRVFRVDPDGSTEVNLSGATDGLYFVRWVGQEASESKKIILSR